MIIELHSPNGGALGRLTVVDRDRRRHRAIPVLVGVAVVGLVQITRRARRQILHHVLGDRSTIHVDRVALSVEVERHRDVLHARTRRRHVTGHHDHERDPAHLLEPGLRTLSDLLENRQIEHTRQRVLERHRGGLERIHIIGGRAAVSDVVGGRDRAVAVPVRITVDGLDHITGLVKRDVLDHIRTRRRITVLVDRVPVRIEVDRDRRIRTAGHFDLERPPILVVLEGAPTLITNRLGDRQIPGTGGAAQEVAVRAAARAVLSLRVGGSGRARVVDTVTGCATGERDRPQGHAGRGERARCCARDLAVVRAGRDAPTSRAAATAPPAVGLDQGGTEGDVGERQHADRTAVTPVDRGVGLDGVATREHLALGGHDRDLTAGGRVAGVVGVHGEAGAARDRQVAARDQVDPAAHAGTDREVGLDLAGDGEGAVRPDLDTGGRVRRVPVNVAAVVRRVVGQRVAVTGGLDQAGDRDVAPLEVHQIGARV